MAGTVTLTTKHIGAMYKYTLTWISTSSGAASYTTVTPIVGLIQREVFVPSATAAPTAAYDVTLSDVDSQDILYGKGANLSATTALDVILGTSGQKAPIAVDDYLALSVSAAGNGKGGKVILYVR